MSRAPIRDLNPDRDYLEDLLDLLDAAENSPDDPRLIKAAISETTDLVISLLRRSS
jgi:hypothetical protein